MPVECDQCPCPRIPRHERQSFQPAIESQGHINRPCLPDTQHGSGKICGALRQYSHRLLASHTIVEQGLGDAVGPALDVRIRFDAGFSDSIASVVGIARGLMRVVMRDI